MFSKWTILLACMLLAFCEPGYILPKCEIDDTLCYKGLLEGLLKSASSSGIKELSIPAMDPLKLKDKNIKIPIPGLLTIYIEDGEVKGVKDCVFDNIVSDVKKGHIAMGMTCNLDIKVSLKLAEVGEALQITFKTKEPVGSGNVQVYLETLHMDIEYFFDFVEKDGVIYLENKPGESGYKYEIGKATFAADNMKLGDHDVTKEINDLLGPNLKSMIKAFGKNFFDVAMKLLTDILQTFFEKTPAKNFITTDLSPYVKNV